MVKIRVYVQNTRIDLDTTLTMNFFTGATATASSSMAEAVAPLLQR